MKKTTAKEVDIDIRAINGSRLCLKEALAPVNIDESQVPAWLNEIAEDGYPCDVFVLIPRPEGEVGMPFGTRGYIHTLMPMLKTNLQKLVSHTVWQILAGYDRAYPHSSGDSSASRLNTHVLNSIKVVAKRNKLDVYAYIKAN